MVGHYRKRQRGLSLVELMVSMVLGIVLVLAIVQIFHNTQNTMILQQAVTLMQENGRYAVKTLRRELAQAGYSGCRGGTFTSTIVKQSHANNSWHLSSQLEPGDTDAARRGGFIRGYDQSDPNGQWPIQFRRKGGAGVADNDSDVVMVRGARTDLAFDVTNNTVVSLAGSSIELAVDATTVASNFSAGDLVMVANQFCSRQAIFQVDDINSKSLLINPPSTGRNCSALLWPNGAYVDCENPGQLKDTPALRAGGQLFHYRASALYVGDSDADASVPALRRVYTTNSGGAIAFVDEELVEGVELMQIRYGYDDDGDGIANLHLPANDSAAGEPWDWRKVVNARITLVLRSTHATERENGADIVVEGVTIPGDRYLRTVVSTLIEWRNRPRAI